MTDARRAECVARIAAAPAALRAAVAGLNDTQLDTPYRPGGWTVRQVVHHVPDSHLNAYTRVRLALTEDTPTIKPYEEARWAELPDARTLPGGGLAHACSRRCTRRWVPLLGGLGAGGGRARVPPPRARAADDDRRADRALRLARGASHVAHVTEPARADGLALSVLSAVIWGSTDRAAICPEVFRIGVRPRRRRSVAGAREHRWSCPPTEFRRLGHELVDRVADFLGASATARSPRARRPPRSGTCSAGARCPAGGTRRPRCSPTTTRLLFEHSLFNGHPRFMGYITSSAAPIGMLADLLAAAVNPNVGGWELSPMASEIEAQTVRWVAELVGYPADCGGLLVSGGNMANFVCFLAGRRAMLGEEVRAAGPGRGGRAAPGVRLRRHPHLDPEGVRPVRPGHRRDPLDPHRRRPAPRAGRAPGRDLPRTWRAATGRSWWWAPPAA